MSTPAQSSANPLISASDPLPVPPLWTARHVARFARCSLRQVGYFRQAGLPFIKIGQLVRFQPHLVIGWLLSHRPEAQGKEGRP